jgi:cyclophilin family peptidyl-prolyl cis-trans isomerase
MQNSSQRSSRRSLGRSLKITLALLVSPAVLCIAALAQDNTSPVKGAASEAAKTADQPAADKKQAADPKAARERFDQIYGEWTAMMSSLVDLNAQYQKAADAEKPEIEKQYNDVAARGEKLAERLKAATIDAYVANPDDKEVAQLLTRIAFTALRDDRYEEADRLARVGNEHKPTDQQFARMAATAAFALHKFADVEPLITKAADGRPLPKEVQQIVADAQPYVALWKQEQKIRAAEAKADDLPRVKLETSKGDITIELFENEAPNTVANFVSLVEKGFYNGVPFHRVLPNFMAQGGDPTGTGTGGPGYNIKDEQRLPNARKHFRGVLSMANTGQPNSGGSQFFLTFVPTSFLDGRHAVFGRVIEGMDVAAGIKRRDPDNPVGQPDKIIKAEVLRDRGHEYKFEKFPE